MYKRVVGRRGRMIHAEDVVDHVATTRRCRA